MFTANTVTMSLEMKFIFKQYVFIIYLATKSKKG